MEFHQFDQLFQKYFFKTFQSSYFSTLFTPNFSGEEAIEPGIYLKYHVQDALPAEVYELLLKFSKRYDCTFITKPHQLIFKPLFSDIKKTYWLEQLDEE